MVAFFKKYVKMYFVIINNKRKVHIYIMKHRVLALLTLLMTFGFVFNYSVKVEAAAKSKPKLNKTKLVLEIGTEERLEILNRTSDDKDVATTDTTDDADAEIDTSIKWTTSNSKVVTVDEAGTLTPVAVGTANITAKADGKKYTCKVMVMDYTGMSVEQKEVISYALQFVGNPYRYGGISLTKGADCSGFTYSVYKKFGYKLTHNAYQQMTEVKKVKMKNIKPGDLIFYGSSKSSCSHVALYIGNGKVVHASTVTTGIVISDYKYRKYCGVGRVLEEETYTTDEENAEENPNGSEDTAPVTSYATSK